jgi:hypothetical protein
LEELWIFRADIDILNLITILNAIKNKMMNEQNSTEEGITNILCWKKMSKNLPKYTKNVLLPVLFSIIICRLLKASKNTEKLVLEALKMFSPLIPPTNDDIIMKSKSSQFIANKLMANENKLIGNISYNKFKSTLEEYQFNDEVHRMVVLSYFIKNYILLFNDPEKLLILRLMMHPTDELNYWKMQRIRFKMKFLINY